MSAVAPRRVSHLTGRAAVITRVAGLALLFAGACLVRSAAGRPEGWPFLSIAGAVAAACGGLVFFLPSRLRTVLESDGVTIGWALGRRRIPWSEVERVLIAPLGSGGERDPVAVTLLLKGGEEVLYSLLGRYSPDLHPAVAPMLAEARRAGVPVEDVTAPPAERSERAEAWRRARLKGWR